MKKLLFSVAIGVLLTGCSSAATEQTTNNNQIQVAFTQANQHPENLLEDVMNSSKSNLDVAIYSLTKKDIVESIIAAKQRGIKVRVITDRQEAHTKSQQQSINELINAGIPVKENSHKGIMHLKVTIADQSTVTTGSYNYTTAASSVNDENLLVIHDANIAKRYQEQFDRMWKDNKNFQDVR